MTTLFCVLKPRYLSPKRFYIWHLTYLQKWITGPQFHTILSETSERCMISENQTCSSITNLQLERQGKYNAVSHPAYFCHRSIQDRSKNWPILFPATFKIFFCNINIRTSFCKIFILGYMLSSDPLSRSDFPDLFSNVHFINYAGHETVSSVHVLRFQCNKTLSFWFKV